MPIHRGNWSTFHSTRCSNPVTLNTTVVVREMPLTEETEFHFCGYSGFRKFESHELSKIVQPFTLISSTRKSKSSPLRLKDDNSQKQAFSEHLSVLQHFRQPRSRQINGGLHGRRLQSPTTQCTLQFTPAKLYPRQNHNDSTLFSLPDEQQCKSCTPSNHEIPLRVPPLLSITISSTSANSQHLLSSA